MKKSLSMGVALAAMLSASPAIALDEAAVMAQLKEMQEQMKQMQQQVQTLQGQLADAKTQAAEAKQEAAAAKMAKLAPAAGGGKAPATPTAADAASEVKITMGPGPKIETTDGQYSFRIGGFLQTDAGAVIDDRRDHSDGTNIRRMRLNASGTIAKDWKYKIENDFAGNSSVITDAYLEYAGIDKWSIMVGQFKEPFSLETLTSDLHTTFLERALPVAFAPDRNIGIQVATYGESPIGNWTAAAGFFGGNTGTASTDDEARDATARITLAPIAEKSRVLHLGVAASHRIPDSASNDVVRYQSRAENRIQNANMVDTGSTLTRVDNVDLLGFEAAGVYGPFSLQGEYMINDVERLGSLADPTFSAYYLEASYFLTGESRNYDAKTGKFDRVKPRWPFSWSQGNWGAFQVAARVSELDLTDNGFNAGELKDTTFALKWIPLGNVMFSANYIIADTDSTASVASDDPEIFLMRAQVDF